MGSGSGRSLDSGRGLLGEEGDGGDGRRLLEAGCDLFFRFAVESQSDGFGSTREEWLRRRQRRMVVRGNGQTAPC